MRKMITGVAAVLLLAGCGAAASSAGGHASRPVAVALDYPEDEAEPTVAPGPAPTPTPTVTYTWPPAACGVERWHVKTGTDPQAATVSLAAPRLTTVAALASLPAPAVLPADARITPVETTVYRVTATLAEYKLEADSDYHLVLSDAGRTMIAEIPDPACVGKASPLLPGIELARTEFDAQYRTAPVWQRAGVMVTVTGVGFFDSIHGQTGVAPNGVELHPVLSIEFGP